MSPAPRARPKAALRKAAQPPVRMDGEELLGRAERAVARALARGAGQAECLWEMGAGIDVELEKGQVSGAATGWSGGGAIRLVRDGRVGFAYFTAPGGEAKAIQQALRNTRLAPATGFSLPAGSKVRPAAKTWDARVAGLDLDDGLALAADLLAGARSTCPKGNLAGGGIGLDAEVAAVASSEGASCWDRSTSVEASASIVLKDGTRAVSAGESQTRHLYTLDAHGVGAEAGTRTSSLRRPGPPGKRRPCDVLLRPEAAGELVVGLAVSAALGDEAMRGRSVWAGKLGTEVADRRLTVADEPRHPMAIGGARFDAEGMQTRRLPFLDRGKLRSYLFDAWDAHLHKGKTTRSAVRGSFKSRPEAGVHHVTLSSSRPASVDRMVASIDDGFLVDSVLGAHTANAATGEFSVTAQNLWRVRGGEVVGASREVAIAGTLSEVLRKVDGVSKEAKAMSGARIPHLLVRGLSIST